ncbi:MAG TPA: hypothetical protein VGI40_05105 [Pirellulaceae bacterium]|jgi:hypothetical protein
MSTAGAADWLPPMHVVIPWTTDTFDALYSVFERDFKHSPPTYEGDRVWFFPDMEDGKEKIFWHLTHKDDKQAGDRFPDPRRCERLPWGRPMLDDPRHAEIVSWDYEEGKGDTKTYVWLKKRDFLVLLKKYPNGQRRLITSFHIDFANYRRKLERKYEERIQ